MSKAFTREDDPADEPVFPRQLSPLPPGLKNYITADGAQRLQEELDRLTTVERPRLINSPEDDLRKRDLQVLDQRVAYLTQSLQTAEVVPPPSSSEVRVRFGATVTVRDRAGELSTYRIVGIDETDVDRGWVSWRSPIARALLNTQIDQRVRFQFPAGEEELQIVSIDYL